MENGAFAPKEQKLHFPYYFKVYDILKASKSVMELRVKPEWSIVYNEGLQDIISKIFFSPKIWSL